MKSFSFFPEEDREGYSKLKRKKPTMVVIKTSSVKAAPTGNTDSEQQKRAKTSSSSNHLTLFLTDPNALACTICKTTFNTSPVFQCSNGHTACSSCCEKYGQCYSCSGNIGSIRCLAIEKVIESAKVLCKNAPYGCKQTSNFNQKGCHEAVCLYEPCVCPSTDCTFHGSPEVLSVHFAEKHSSTSVRFQFDVPFVVAMGKNEPFLVLQEEVDGVIFILNNRREYKGSACTMNWIGSNLLKRRFRYRLAFKRKGSSLRFKSSAKCVKTRVEASLLATAAATEFFFVPRYFSEDSEQLMLDVCIRSREGAAAATRETRINLWSCSDQQARAPRIDTQGRLHFE